MEDVLDVYTRPYDPLYPVVCLDESNKQLIKETCPPMPLEPGQPQRQDYEYERNGVINLFMLFEPLAGWRHRFGNRATHQARLGLLHQIPGG